MSTLFKIPTSYEEFLKEFPPKDLVLILSDFQTIKDSLSEERITFEELSQAYEDRSMISYISIWLDVLSLSLNLKTGINDTMKIAFMIYSRYSHWYLPDLKLVGDRILHGEGVEFYHSTADTPTLLRAFSQYNQERRMILYAREQNPTTKVEDIVNNERRKTPQEISEIMGSVKKGLVW